MQILIAILMIIVFFGLLIYKINGKFESKEIFILTGIIIVSILVFVIYDKNQENALPTAFKNKYAQEKKSEILKLSSELLNNKNITSKSKFIYKFTYIINKENQEYLCTANKVIIKKIEDELVFENFNNLQETCLKK